MLAKKWPVRARRACRFRLPTVGASMLAPLRLTKHVCTYARHRDSNDGLLCRLRDDNLVYLRLKVAEPSNSMADNFRRSLIGQIDFCGV